MISSSANQTAFIVIIFLPTCFIPSDSLLRIPNSLLAVASNALLTPPTEEPKASPLIPPVKALTPVRASASLFCSWITSKALLGISGSLLVTIASLGLLTGLNS